MFKMIKILLCLSCITLPLFAQTPFILEKFSTAHIVVKTHSNELLGRYKANISELLHEYAQDLNISVTNKSNRVLGVDIQIKKINKNLSIIDLELFIHEPTIRLEDKEEVFSIVYQNSLIFVVKDIEEDIEDNLITLLEELQTQYQEDNE
ncbi:MAG: hypothetical protein Q9M40_07860 [Sulfurimonas sp.]|nr:hypothetical protein [Sulfurimonas sp.]